MIKIGIYKITSPNSRVYIGQSNNIDRRFNQYKRLVSCNRQQMLYLSFLKYGVDDHIFEVLELCEEALLNEREQFYIDFYKTTNRKFGLNLRMAGSKGRHINETKNKISKANKRKKRTIEQRINISNAKKLNPTKFWLGEKRPIETINKIRESLKGVVNANKPIIQYDLNMNEIGRFEGATDASRKLKISRSAIKNNLLGLSKTSNNNIFKYAV